MEPTANHSLVEIMDGTGDHFASLSVFHELHCLKTLRQYQFPTYYPDIWDMFKPGPDEMIGEHIDHCFDLLRQSAMCHADMTLLPTEWWDEEEVPQIVVHAPHVCANWNQLSSWAVEHSFHPWGNGLVRHGNQ